METQIDSRNGAANSEEAQALYEREIKAKVEPEHIGKIIAIDVESGDHELGDTVLTATKPLRSRRPNGRFFALRVGYDAVYALSGARQQRTS
jgi:hypothetical protein